MSSGSTSRGFKPTSDAVLWNLEIIGEASKHPPEQVRTQKARKTARQDLELATARYKALVKSENRGSR